MRSSYSEEDVILLLKDITGLVEPQPAKVREILIQSGKHYSEMLPVEYVPTDRYMQVYHNALKHYAKPVANAVGMLADKIIENKGKKMARVPCVDSIQAPSGLSRWAARTVSSMICTNGCGRAALKSSIK